MKSPKEILNRSSKKLCLEAVQCAVQSNDFFNELLSLAFNEEDEPYSHRAGWSMVYLSQRHPNLIRPHMRSIATRLSELKGHSQIASFLRIFDEVKYDHGNFGDVLDYCIHTIRMPVKREYLKVISLNIMLTFGKVYPELIPELIQNIEEAQPTFEMQGLKKKTKSVLKDLNRLLPKQTKI